jgi:hypothetical protein
MQANPTSTLIQRAIVLQLLRKDHPREWSQAELEHEISRSDLLSISDALAQLEPEGVVVVDGEQAQASSCAHYLDKLDLIGV